MNTQEQEDQDFHPQSEERNCIEEAGGALATLNAVEAEKINRHLAAGEVVIALEAAYHCRATDAVVGTARFFAEKHASRAAAEKRVKALYEVSDPDYSFVILPAVPASPVPPVATGEPLPPF